MIRDELLLNLKRVVRMTKTLITAHTGCMNTPPDSIQSVLERINTGAEIIEVDVNVTKDGIAVLVHDDPVSTPFGNKRVRDLTFEEWERLSGKGGHPAGRRFTAHSRASSDRRSGYKCGSCR